MATDCVACEYTRRLFSIKNIAFQKITCHERCLRSFVYRWLIDEFKIKGFHVQYLLLHKMFDFSYWIVKKNIYKIKNCKSINLSMFKLFTFQDQRGSVFLNCLVPFEILSQSKSIVNTIVFWLLWSELFVKKHVHICGVVWSFYQSI